MSAERNLDPVGYMLGAAAGLAVGYCYAWLVEGALLWPLAGVSVVSLLVAFTIRPPWGGDRS